MTDKTDNVGGMARGKSRHVPTLEQRQKIQSEIHELQEHFGSNAEVARQIGVSRGAVINWQNMDDYPRPQHLERIRLVLAKVGRRGTKVTHRAPSTVDVDEAASVASPTPTTNVRDQWERVGMVALLRAVERGEEPAWMLELELCLLYHRRDIDSGMVSQTTIAMAREGGFEDDGCAAWDAPRWWGELRDADVRVRSERRLRRAKRLDDGEPQN